MLFAAMYVDPPRLSTRTVVLTLANQIYNGAHVPCTLSPTPSAFHRLGSFAFALSYWFFGIRISRIVTPFWHLSVSTAFVVLALSQAPSSSSFVPYVVVVTEVSDLDLL